MNIELTDDEQKVIKHALEVYLGDLREEVVKAEKHEWKQGLHNEEDVLKKVIGMLG